MPETKKAIELQAGDRILGEGTFPPSLFSGTVKLTVVVDRGVQIVLTDGGTYIRPEDHPVTVDA